MRIAQSLVVGIALLLSACASLATDRVLTWNPVTTDSSGNPLPAGVTVTYNIYGAIQGQPLKLMSNVDTTTNVRSNQEVGTACYAVTALVTPATAIVVQESAPTPTICDTIDPPAPPPPPKPAAPAAPTGFSIQHAVTAPL